jgi:nicotinic acid mononucleotide adenylyltransferase
MSPSHPSLTEALELLFAGRISAVRANADGQATIGAELPAALLPGSFHPLHEGHVRLASVAAGLVDAPVAFELSVTNVDKPDLTAVEVQRRLSAFSSEQGVWLTHAPRFVEKARIFPRCVFIVGADTAARISAPRYYGENEAARRAALAEFRSLGCRFLVAGRTNAAGAFLELNNLALPAESADLFTAIPGELFRLDISSTRLRTERVSPS